MAYFSDLFYYFYPLPYIAVSLYSTQCTVLMWLVHKMLITSLAFPLMERCAPGIWTCCLNHRYPQCPSNIPSSFQSLNFTLKESDLLTQPVKIVNVVYKSCWHEFVGIWSAIKGPLRSTTSSMLLTLEFPKTFARPQCQMLTIGKALAEFKLRISNLRKRLLAVVL